MIDFWSKFDALGSLRTICVSNNSLPNVREYLEMNRIRTYTLDTINVEDKKTLLSCLQACFDFEEEYKGSELSSWDVVLDLTWQCFMERSDKTVIVLWLNADKIIESQLQLFLDTLESLNFLGDMVERQAVTEDAHPVKLKIVLFGDGIRFRKWT